MLKHALVFSSLIFILSNVGFAVGGFSQATIVYNNTDSPLSLNCRGGAHIVREANITLAPHKAQYFLLDALVEPYENLLGGSYQCSMSIGPFSRHNFSLTLENAQEIAVWTLGPDYQIARTFDCAAEGFHNFNRPSEIVRNINAGARYSGSWRCQPKPF